MSLSGDDYKNDFLIAICDLQLTKLNSIHALLTELDDSELVTRLGKELSLDIPDLMEAISAFIGVVRDEKAAA